jgi:hypothetical protein
MPSAWLEGLDISSRLGSAEIPEARERRRPSIEMNITLAVVVTVHSIPSIYHPARHDSDLSAVRANAMENQSARLPAPTSENVTS